MNIITPTSAVLPPLEQTIWDALAQSFREFANRPALCDPSGDLTYRDLETRVERTARALMRNGEATGAVAVLTGHGIPFVCAMLAVLRAGGYYVPLNPLAGPAQNGIVLEDAGALTVLTDGECRAMAAEIAGPDRRLIDIDGAIDTVRGADADPPGAADAIAGLFYTSGTTGRPKGVVHSQRSLLYDSALFAKTMGIGPDDRVTYAYHGSTCASVKSLIGPLLRGAAICPWNTGKHGVIGMAEWLADRRVSVVHLFRGAYARLMKSMPDDLMFPAFRVFMVSSEPVFAVDYAAWDRRFPSAQIFFNHVGSTEAGSYTVLPLGHGEAVSDGVLPAGFALDGKSVSVQTASGAEAEPGEVGEIVIESRYMADGYWNRPDLTEKAFSQIGPGLQRFRTGDLGRIDRDGCLHLLGRGDGRYKLNGRWIEPAEIEAALVAVDGIGEAVVVLQDKGNGRNSLVAYVSPKATVPTLQCVRARLYEQMPQGPMPSRVIALDDLPRLPNGKIDRRDLNGQA